MAVKYEVFVRFYVEADDVTAAYKRIDDIVDTVYKVYESDSDVVEVLKID